MDNDTIPASTLHLHLQDIIHELRNSWKITAGENVAPAPEIILDMLARYPLADVRRAVEVTARKHATGTLDLTQNWVGYLHAVARNPDFRTRGLEQ